MDMDSTSQQPQHTLDNVTRMVRTLLAASDYSQAELAEAISMKPSGLTRRMKGDTSWQLKDIEAIAAYFDLPISVFFEDPRPLLGLDLREFKSRWDSHSAHQGSFFEPFPEPVAA